LPADVITSVTDGEVPEDGIHLLSDRQQQDLSDLKQRRAALESKLKERDVKELTEMLHVMKEKKISLLDGINETSADDIQKIFNLQSKDHIEAVLKRTERFQGAIQELRDESSDVM
jgi:GTP cyclohydrolase II